MSEALPAPDDLVQHVAFVRRLARSLLADPHAADDVVQETWRASLERAPQGDPRGWLARVVRNFVHRKRRGDARRAERERSVARDEALPPAEASLERTETLQRVVDAVRALEEPYRAAILARYYEDLAPQAIAAREGIPVATVHSRLKRGLARLREELERKERAWRPSLGLIAGESPCLPPHAGDNDAWSLTEVKILAAAVLACVAGWGVWRAFMSSAPRPVTSATLETSLGVADSKPAAAVRSADARESVASATPSGEAALAGRVLDESGAPVPGANVQVLAGDDPFGPECDAPAIAWDAYRGRIFACDAEGRWRAVLPAPRRVRVVVEETSVFQRVPGRGDERWVTAPAVDVDFVLRRVPTATLEVRVVEGATRSPLEDFSIVLHGPASALPSGGIGYDGGYWGRRAEHGLVREEIAIRDPAGRTMYVELSEPRLGGLWAKLGFGEGVQPEQEVHLAAGATEAIVLALPERGVVRGIVVDPGGAPVPDALVFFGDETRARGDEPFEPLRPERIQDGARTAPDGWFELRGEGERVTAVHADLSSTTVDVRRASRIALGSRGALRGRVLDHAGRPVAALRLGLDAPAVDSGAATDADGRFAFERVEAGEHALWSGAETPLACMRLAAGEELELELTNEPARPLTLELHASEPPALAGVRAVAIGRAQVFDVRALAPGSEEGTLFTAARPRPGSYWLVTQSGFAASFELEPEAERVVVPLGSAELVVRARRRTSVQVVPAGADSFLRLAAARLGIAIDDERAARFRLLPGSYALVGEAGAELCTLELPPDGLALTLD